MNVEMENISTLDWSKRSDGLMPAIVQDARTRQVLMEGYVSPETLRETLETGKVVFFSRRHGRWMKGETSGNFLNLARTDQAVRADCDRDALLILANPIGPTCHTGVASCFGDQDPSSVSDIVFLWELQQIIARRQQDRPEGSYTTKLFDKGITRIAQKVGEEGVEVALAAVAQTREQVIEESADLLFHLSVLWRATGVEMTEVVQELERRHHQGRPQLGLAAPV